MKKGVDSVRLRWRRTKILATIGPATDDMESIKSLIDAGVNVFRLNMSHGDHDYHRGVFSRIRRCARDNDATVAILMDLCGPKIRVGKFQDGAIELKPRSRITISCESGVGSADLVMSQYRQLYRDVKTGDRVLLDDGNLECKVVGVSGKKVECRVVYGGLLKNNKGMNLPDTAVSVSSFTAKDKRDAALAVELGADFVALSFVRSIKDVAGLQRYMRRLGDEIPVIAKIEKPEAVDNIDEIVTAAYGIMIARGDLGIELEAQKVPMIQRRLINVARSRNKPVIVATQMMESMIGSSRPTRAEVGDVANAALSSADAVMLSAETAVGKYPVKAVRIMDSILREMEKEQWLQGTFGEDIGKYDESGERLSSRRAVAHAANNLASDLRLQGILVPTDSGHTAAVLSACRPSSPLLGISSNPAIVRRLSIHWGVLPCPISASEAHDWHLLSNEIGQRFCLTETGNRLLLVSGFNHDEARNEPVLKIMKISSDGNKTARCRRKSRTRKK